MKNFKRVLALMLIALMALSFAACGKSPADKLIGKWNFDMKSLYKMAGVEEDQIAMFESIVGEMSGSMEFLKDGKVILTMTAMGETDVDESTYTVEGSKIIIDGDPAEFKIEKNTLTITDEEVTMVLIKAK